MKYIVVYMATVLSLLMFSSPLKAAELYLQTGSWQGFQNIGVGQNYKKFDFIASYGFTPTYIGGHDINQFNFKSNYNFINIESIETKVYITAFLIYNPDERLQVFNKAPYPETNYYPSTALLFGLGGGIKKEIIKKHSLFIEWSILSPEMERFYNNKDYDDPLNEFFGMGIGYSYQF